jgi:hypothetical protein
VSKAVKKAQVRSGRRRLGLPPKEALHLRNCCVLKQSWWGAAAVRCRRKRFRQQGWLLSNGILEHL